MLGLMEYVLRDKYYADITMMTAFRKQITHKSLEYASISRSSNMNRHGPPRVFLKPTGTLS